MQSLQGIIVYDWYVGFAKVPDSHDIRAVAFPPGTKVFITTKEIAELIPYYEIDSGNVVSSPTGEIYRMKVKPTHYSLGEYHTKLFNKYKRLIYKDTEVYLQCGQRVRTGEDRYVICTNNYLVGLVFTDVYIVGHQIYLSNNLKHLSYV